MFDIGFWELLLIGVVALVIIGPERLPEVAKSAGVYVAKFRRFVAGVKSDIDAELQTGELKKILGDQSEQIRELKNIVDTTRKELETSTSNAIKSANEVSSSMESKYNEMGNESKAESAKSSVRESTASDTASGTEKASDETPAAKSESKTSTDAANTPASDSSSGAGDKPASSV